MQATLHFTQGDNAILSLTATDGNGNPINITGAVFTSFILGVTGQVVPFADSQHAITNPTGGQFTLTLSSTDTQNCNIGDNKDVLTKIVIGGNTTYFRGAGILKVDPPVPLS